MKRSSSKATPSSDEFRGDVDWELRPGGMIVQKRHVGSGSDSDRLIRIKVSHGSYHHLIILDAHSTFGDLKRILQKETGLEPSAQRLLFRGKEKETDECLHMAGLNDMSKVVLMEDPASKERKLEEIKRNRTAADDAVAEITVEVDKLAEKVVAVEGSVNGGKRAEEKEVNVLTELLMMQLLKLDAIETDGDAKLQRRTQVVRVQNLVDRLDKLKCGSSNPLTNAAISTTAKPKWDTFESKLTISSTKITHHWQLFD